MLYSSVQSFINEILAQLQRNEIDEYKKLPKELQYAVIWLHKNRLLNEPAKAFHFKDIYALILNTPAGYKMKIRPF